MWSKLQTLAQHPAVQWIRKFIGDPVLLYAVFLVTTVMYYYHADMIWLYVILSVLIGWVMMRFYDFVARHKWIGPLADIAYMIVGLYIVRMITTIGQTNYPISFGVWFLTPQSVVTFSGWYTAAIFLLMLGFLTSTVYYFAKVRYRMSMQFMIMLIPLSMYAKEGLQMPALLVIILLASYFLLMIYCRQMRNPQIRFLPNLHGTLSIAAYVAAFSIIAAIIPKPQITADREYIENAMSYSSWSDVLMQAISMFTETTDNRSTVSNNARTIFYADAPESLRLRTQTYTYYDGETDSWSVDHDFDYPDQPYAEPMSYKPQELVQAIVDAARKDPDFAAEYGLTEAAGITLPEQAEQELFLFTYYGYAGMNVLPSPTRIISIDNSGIKRDGRLSRTNTFRASTYSRVSMNYYPESYAYREQVMQVLTCLSHETYRDLLLDAQFVLEGTAQEYVVRTALTEFVNAETYRSTAQAGDWDSDVIDTLAVELTVGLDSDMEKAIAIERYFYDEDFVYDLAYEKADGENVEDFLNDTRRGVCYEYATAMTLLCRSAGLPTRFVQGYNMSERYNAEAGGRATSFVIKVRNAHAFPEVYIAGYGWMSFEPTIPSEAAEEESTAENHYVMLWGFVLLGAALLAVGGFLLMPKLREAYFRRRISRMTPQQSAAAIFRRQRTVLRMPDSTTVAELAARAQPFCPQTEPAYAMYAAMDVLLYSQQTEKAMTAQELAGAYTAWQTLRAGYEKEQTKQRRKAKRKRKEKDSNVRQ